MPKRIPIRAAKAIASEFGLQQVILVAWDHGRTHVVTYGDTAEACDQAAQGGDFVKKALGWPETGPAYPSRVKALQKRVAELEAKLESTEPGDTY